jgi:hypothetical protein
MQRLMNAPIMAKSRSTLRGSDGRELIHNMHQCSDWRKYKTAKVGGLSQKKHELLKDPGGGNFSEESRLVRD